MSVHDNAVQALRTGGSGTLISQHVEAEQRRSGISRTPAPFTNSIDDARESIAGASAAVVREPAHRAAPLHPQHL